MRWPNAPRKKRQEIEDTDAEVAAPMAEADVLHGKMPAAYEAMKRAMLQAKEVEPDPALLALPPLVGAEAGAPAPAVGTKRPCETPLEEAEFAQEFNQTLLQEMQQAILEADAMQDDEAQDGEAQRRAEEAEKQRNQRLIATFNSGMKNLKSSRQTRKDKLASGKKQELRSAIKNTGGVMPGEGAKEADDLKAAALALEETRRSVGEDGAALQHNSG